MSYIALYRKWRPKTFTEVVGQKQVSHTLMRAIEEDKVAHAYLFAGPRGTGKTSMAKIFGRAINCAEGPTTHPCGVCESCKQGLQGQSLDIIEIDAASNRGIDDVRSLREQVNFLPVIGRKKVFIIDEAHMLTTEAWNALLKTIEEPPSHVMFIFATTEPEKLPVTIVSRCQRYTFRRITAQDIAEQLLYVAKESGIDLDPAAAQLIAVHADGGLRDALSILDQCSSMALGTVTTNVVEDMIGLVSKAWVIQLLNAIEEGDGATVLASVQQALSEGRDSRQILDTLAQHGRALILAKVLPESEELLMYDVVKADFLAQAQAFSMEALQNYVKQLYAIQSDAKLVDNPRVIVEMGLLSLMSAGSNRISTVEERLGRLEQQQNRGQEGILNRLAELEQHGISVGVAAPRPTEACEDVPPPPEEEWGSMDGAYDMPHPMDVAPLEEATSAPVPPKPSGHKVPPRPKVAPKPKTMQQQKPASVVRTTAPAPAPVRELRGDTPVVDSAQYGSILGNVIKWLESHNRKMVGNFYRGGALIHLDGERAVMAFDTPLASKILTQEKQMEEALEAFEAVLKYPVVIDIEMKPKGQVKKAHAQEPKRRPDPMPEAPIVDFSKEIAKPAPTGTPSAPLSEGPVMKEEPKVEMVPVTEPIEPVVTSFDDDLPPIMGFDVAETILDPVVKEMEEEAAKAAVMGQARRVDARDLNVEGGPPLLKEALAYAQEMGYEVYEEVEES